jgi:hypothetical protein
VAFFNGDVVAFIIHPVRAHARAQVNFRRAHIRAHRVTRTTSRIDDDVVGEVIRALLREAEFHQQVWDVLLVGVSGRILLSYNLIELRFRVGAARTEAVVPDVKRLERTTDTSLHKLPGFGEQRRRQDLFEHLAHARFRYFAAFVETARDESRRRLRDREIHSRGNAFRESLGQASFSPLASRPVAAVSQPLLKCEPASENSFRQDRARDDKEMADGVEYRIPPTIEDATVIDEIKVNLNVLGYLRPD